MYYITKGTNHFKRIFMPSFKWFAPNSLSTKIRNKLPESKFTACENYGNMINGVSLWNNILLAILGLNNRANTFLLLFVNAIASIFSF